MAKTIEVALWDDLELAAGRHVRADRTVRLGWAGKVIELELTGENFAALEKKLAPYLQAGHVPDASPSVSGAQNSRERRVYRARLRAWAEKEDIRNPRDPSRLAFVSKKGTFTYPDWLEQRYQEHLLSRGKGA